MYSTKDISYFSSPKLLFQDSYHSVCSSDHVQLAGAVLLQWCNGVLLRLIPYWTKSNGVNHTGQQRLLKYKHRTGSTEPKVKPHGSTGTDDFTGDRHNMSRPFS